MKPVLVIQTGGTIGASTVDKAIDISEKQGNVLLDLYRAQTGSAVEIEVVKPFSLLSENMVPAHWLALIDCLAEHHFYDYAGIVITCGSDTLPYTAVALSYHFATTPIPIMLVCANKPLDQPRSNGLANFSTALSFISHKGWPGIFVPYKNTDGRMNLHLGTRIMEADSLSDNFTSFGDGMLNIDTQLSQNNPHNRENAFSHLLTRRKLSVHWPEAPCFEQKVLALKTYPGLDYAAISTKGVTAILHHLYHGSTANVEGPGSCALSNFIERNPETDHYLLSFKPGNPDLYATSYKLLEAGGIPLRSISFEAALTKLYFAYGQNKIKPQDYMFSPLFFEFAETF